MTSPTPRITQSEIIRALLERGSSERSSVTIARNAKGEVQLEVIVRTGDAGAVQTPEDAERIAGEVYDRLVARYPYTGAVTAA